MRSSRRELLVGGVAVLASEALGCKAPRSADDGPAPVAPDEPEEDVTPTEDLMREHGLLDRVLLVYDECARRLESNAELSAIVLPASARLLRTFVHEYHERLEEEHVFPRCEHSLVHVALVRTLRDQHAVGRKITAYVEAAVAGGPPKKDERKKVASALRSFSRMYRPHAAREDTVLFPAFRDLFREGELTALGAQFEKREHELFGDHGFERKVAEVGELETALDIQDLARATAADFAR